MMRLQKTVPIPAPEPATPTVAAPAPVNMAAVLMSLEMVLVWKLWLGIREVRGLWTPKLLRPSSVVASTPLQTAALRGAPDQGAGRDELGAGLHFQGEGPRQESCFQGPEFFTLAILTGVRWNLRVVLIYISLMTRDVEHFLRRF